MSFDGHQLDHDWEIRLAAFAALECIVRPTGGIISRAEMDQGFEFEGERIRFASPPRGRGIWRPRQMGRDGPALSIWTAAVRKGVEPRYDDEIGSEGSFVYRYQGRNPDDWDNVAVRRAYEMDRPLMYFYGVAPGVYEAIYPAFVVEDDPANLTFRVSADTAHLGEIALLTGGSAVPLKEYATRVVKQRLHQHRFRELVLSAYRGRCAICRLKRPVLLDAAHILPDRDQRGLPEVPNGLALCKIHHAAFDARILGIAPDYKVHVRGEILKDRDGPMLEHGLQRMQDRLIETPGKESLKPNREYLEERFSRFLAA